MRVLISIALSLASIAGYSQKSRLNIYDSAAVEAFIKKASVCDLIETARTYRTAILKDQGFTERIMDALGDRAETGAFILLGPNGETLPIHEQALAFARQLRVHRKRHNCRSASP